MWKITLALFCSASSDGINRNDVTIYQRIKSVFFLCLHSNNDIHSSLILCLLYNSKQAIWIFVYRFIVIIRQSEWNCERRSLFANKDIENHHLVENLNAFAIFQIIVDGKAKFSIMIMPFVAIWIFFFKLELAIMNTIPSSQSDRLDLKKISFVERELNLITSVIFIIFMYVWNK